VTLALRARGVLTGLAAASLAVAGLPAVAAADDDPAPLVGMDAPGVVAGSYIVVLKDDASATAVRQAGDRADDAGGTVTHRYTEAIKGYAAKLSDDELAKVRQDPTVAHVEPVVTLRMADTPVRKLDNQANPDWGLDRIDQRALPLNQDYFWNAANEGAGVKAYVIDSGIRRTHSEFTGRVLAGYDATIENNGPNDCDGHGTHVAGTIGGTTYGVAKKVSIVPVQVFRCDGGDTDNSALLAGIDYVVKNHTGGPAVANLSLAGPARYNGAIDKAVSKMLTDNITVVVASGNFYANDADPDWRTPIACNYTPAHIKGVITVSATKTSDSRDTEYATYGSCVDVFAPGTDIVSAGIDSDTSTYVMTGTSMATPHVAGIAAAYLSTHTNATPAQVHAAITGSATPNAVKNAGSGSPNRLAYSRVFPPRKASSADRLSSGEGLRFNESIRSPNGLYRLQQQSDGNLVLAKLGNRVLWSLGRKGSWTTLQDNGNLVSYLYTKGVWATNTGGNGSSQLRVQDDGNVMLHRLSDGKAVWSTKTKQKTAPPQVTTPSDRLTAGQALYRGGASLVSPNGRYAVYVRAANGVLVVRDQVAGRDLWTSKALSDDWLTLQTDGNVVLYASSGTSLWSTGTGGKGDARLIIQNDGNFVLYDNSPNKALWSSRSGKL
jgi:subtilisin family serine protease